MKTQTPTFSVEEKLKVWEKILILVGEGADQGQYEARIDDFLNGGIVITQPVFVRGKSLLRDGIKVAVQYHREDASYQFHSRIYAKKLRNGKRTLLTPPQRLRRIQRRRFVRIDSSSNVKYNVFDASSFSNTDEQEIRWYDSRTINVSGGGVLIIVEEKIPIDTIVLLKLQFLVKHNLSENVLSICRRSFETDDIKYAGMELILSENLGEYISSRDIVRLPNEIKRFDRLAQEHLVSQIFAEQVELRRKGLL